MKATKITPAQLKALQTTFSRLGFDNERRHELVYSFTGGRTESSRELTSLEAYKILKVLNGEADKETKDKVKSLLASIYRLSMLTINKGFSSDTEDERRMNMAKVNMFCRQRGSVKKNISQMTLAELEKTKKQFEAMLSNNKK